MKTIYLDCHSGIAGDMTLSALVDLGADPDYIRSHLAKLPLDRFEMNFVPVVRRGISAKWLELKFDENSGTHDHHHEHDHHHHHEHHHHEHDHHHHHHEHDDHHHHEHDDHHHHHGHDHHHHHHEHDDHHHHDHDHGHVHRKAADILLMIERSELPPRVKQRSTAIFELIAEAEGKIHGMDPKDVHFHEVGGMDSIIDIIGVCLALEYLDADELLISPVPTGTGRIRIAHGVYPVPAPATAELLRGVPLSSFTVQGELTTPTGAGIAKALADGYGPLPAGTIERIGYGAGTKDFEHPNVLRAILMNRESADQTPHTVTVLEAQVDDMTGEALGYAMERLFEAGALDVFYTPVFMKKNRPGVLITVICAASDAGGCEKTLLSETSTFGFRKSVCERKVLERRIIRAVTPYGEIRVKQALDGDRLVHQSPEYEDAARAAREHGVSLETVYREAVRRL